MCNSLPGRGADAGFPPYGTVAAFGFFLYILFCLLYYINIVLFLLSPGKYIPYSSGFDHISTNLL